MTTHFNLLCIALAAAVAPALAQADTPEPAGMIKTSQGSVTVARDGQQIPGALGSVVFAGDRVRTGPDSSVGITLRDDTRLAAGPDSTLLINDFRFNTSTHEGNILASLLKGTFSIVTGLIARQSPKSVNFKTPTMTLGIRGTEFVVEVEGASE